MSFEELMAELPKLTPTERREVVRRLVELDEAAMDHVASARADELASGKAQPKTQGEVFRNARAALNEAMVPPRV